MLTHFSLFSGIGGIDLAAEWAGFTTIGQCEYADYPTRVLEKHWPDVERWKDVRTVTRYSIRQRGFDPDGITLLSGGFPCQPHSLAGKRKASADERDLWGEFARVICETHPRWVLGENVAGLLSSENGRFFGNVLRDLAEMGYRVGWGSWGACDVGANHRRERVFIVAHALGNGQQRIIGNAFKGGCNANAEHSLVAKGGVDWDANRANGETIAGICKRPRSESAGICEDVADTGCIRETEWWNAGFRQAPGIKGNRANQRGRAVLNVGWEWWSVEPDVGRVANGVPSRVDRLKCLGNAVVPYQVYPLLQAIADIEQGQQVSVDIESAGKGKASV